MHTRIPRVIILTALITFIPLVDASPHQINARNDLRIWSEFVSLLRLGAISEAHIRPAYASSQTMLEFLGRMRMAAVWEEWERQPEVFRVGPKVHFVTTLSERGASSAYSFTFLVDGDRWFLEHFESIVVRLDRVGAPPISEFPDLAEQKKAWMRQEKYWSQVVVFFLAMRKAAGADAAFSMLHDGAGYLVEAKTWVPFYPAAKAFILYLCWEQSRLHGNPVTLERLTDTDATVTIDPIYLRLYRQSGHMRLLLSPDDYRKVFEVVWRDRAVAAGWDITFSYQSNLCRMHFVRARGSQGRP